MVEILELIDMETLSMQGRHQFGMLILGRPRYDCMKTAFYSFKSHVPFGRIQGFRNEILSVRVLSSRSSKMPGEAPTPKVIGQCCLR